MSIMTQDSYTLVPDAAAQLIRRPRKIPGVFNRVRQARWDRLHLITVGCRLTRWEASYLNSLVIDEGTTKNALIRRLLIHWMAERLPDNDNPFRV